MDFLLKFVILNLLLVFGNCSTTCQDSQKHFTNLCFVPKPLDETKFDWLITRQAQEGLHSILGNDIVRLHLAEYLKGEEISSSDNFDSLCTTSTIQVTEFGNSSFGNVFGFGNLTSNWKCKFSKDFPLLFMCDVDIPIAPKYHGKFNSYISYTDNTNFVVEVYCFPNGEVGWVASSINKSFTNEDKKIIMDHITSLGFSEDDTVTLYEEKYCTPEIK